MAGRFLGPRGGTRRRYVMGPLLLVAVIALLVVAVAQAVHDDNLFELGGSQQADILGDDNLANGPDWGFVSGTSDDGIFKSDGTVNGLFGGLAAAFLRDDTSQKGATDKTTFSGAGGSNKNNDPMSTADCAARVPPLTGSACDTWHWDAGNVPAKDDLVNSYVYATMPTSGPLEDDLILYGGLERLDESGDSHLDLEFLQSSVNIVDQAVSGNGAIPCNDPGQDPTPCEFSGIREVNDVIVSMDFVQGGGIGSVEVRRWNGNEYVLEGVEGGEGCNADPDDPTKFDTICAFNNGSIINGGPWPNFDKTGNEIQTLLPNAFTEIGVNVTELLGTTPCISTVMGKSRSSQSFTAELKDFSAPQGFPICGGKITIGPDDVNAVGDSHTFTVNVAQTIGNTETAAPDGTIVDVDLTDANGAVNDISSNTCASPGTVNGSCTVTFSSDTAGTVTGHASADIVIDGVTTHVETNGTGQNSGDAVKRFVDARIGITPDDVNSIGESHTFTVEVEQDDGLPANATGGDAVTGFGPATGATPVTPVVTLTGDADSVVDTCGSVGTVNGTCTVTFTSDTAGTVVGHASVTFSVGGVSLTRETDGLGGNTGDATKEFVAGSIAWTKKDNAGNLQGGATFQVCRTHNADTSPVDPSPDTFVDITPDVCVSVVDDTDGVAGGTLDEDPDPGEFKLSGLRLGRYTVKETAAPPGFEPDPGTVTVELTLVPGPREVTIATAFINQRPILKITGFGYTNEATGIPTAGVVSGTATYSVNLKNYGGAAATLSNSSLKVEASALPAGGTLTCGPNDDPTPFTRSITGTVNPNGGTLGPITLACKYTGMPDGKVITATLNVKYTTNTSEREASGSPATISFTVQSD